MKLQIFKRQKDSFKKSSAFQSGKTQEIKRKLEAENLELEERKENDDDDDDDDANIEPSER